MGRGGDTSPRNGRGRAPDGAGCEPRQRYFSTICSEVELSHSVGVSRVTEILAVQQPSRRVTVLTSKEGCGRRGKTHLSVSQTQLSRASFLQGRHDVFTFR